MQQLKVQNDRLQFLADSRQHEYEQAIRDKQALFKEKFGIPRQPQLCNVESTIWLKGNANSIDAIRGIEMHSHIWVLFQFHQNRDKGWQPLVRPPRMDGNKKFRSRALIIKTALRFVTKPHRKSSCSGESPPKDNLSSSTSPLDSPDSPIDAYHHDEKYQKRKSSMPNT